jgi:hypothetical protein
MAPRILDRNASETTRHQMKINSITWNVAENGEHHHHGWVRSLKEGSFSAEREVDFEHNPTLLSRLILNRKFLSGIKRLRIHPDEAIIWVCSRKRPPIDQRRRKSWPDTTPHDSFSHQEYSLRQLPLHMACSSLVQISDPSLREELERLITNLVVAYPQACSKRDHDRRLPLHEVIRSNASPYTVSALLIAYPEAVGERDRYGNLPQGLFQNRIGDDAKKISELLQRGRIFWEQSRSEAMLRMKMDLRASSRESAYSTQVLLSDSGLDSHSAHDEDAHVTETKESSPSNAKVEPSMSQAKNRTVHLEQLLEEMYERNYSLAEVVKTLTREKEETVYQLLDEKSDLQKQLYRLGIVLRDMGLSDSGHQMDSSNEMEGISMMSMDPERPTVLTTYLLSKATSLQEENETLEVKNDNYRKQVDLLQAKVLKLELAIPVTDEDSVSVSVRDTLSAMPSLSRSEREASDRERLLALKVLELQKQVNELKKAEQIVEGPANGQQYSHAKKPSMDLEAQLKIIDTRSHSSDLPVMNAELDSQATPKTMPSVANTAATGEVLNSKASRRGSSLLSESGKSVSSWGLLSLSQSKAKLSRKQQAQQHNFTPMPSLPQGLNSFHSSFHSSFHDSLGTFAESADTDDLDILFKSAADFYDGDKSAANVFDGHKSAMNFGSCVAPKPRRRRARRFSDGGASPTLKIVKVVNDARNKPESDPDPLVATARLLAAEEDVAAIMQAVEEKMETELSIELVAALRGAALQHAAEEIAFIPENTFHVFHAVAESIIEYKLIDEAQKLYGEPIPTKIVNVLRAASMVLVETSQREISAIENMKQKLKEELLDALIDTAERQLHEPLPYDITIALKHAGMSFYSLLTEKADGSIHIDFQAMDQMVKEAQRLFGKPFSQEVLIALRRASFVLQSRLEGTDIGGDHPEQTPRPRKERKHIKKGRGRKKTSKTEHDASSSQAKRANAMNSSAPALFATGSNSYLKDSDREKGSRSIDGKSFPSIFEESYGDDAKADDQTEARSLATRDSTTDGSLDIANIFPVLEGNKSSALESKLKSINEASKSQEIDWSSSSLSPGRTRRGGRRPGVDGGDNPSESSVLCQIAAIASAVRHEGGDDFSDIIRCAPVATKDRSPVPDLSYIVYEDDDSAQGDDVEKPKQGGSSSSSLKSDSSPSLVKKSGKGFRSVGSGSRSKVPKSISRSEVGRKSAFQPPKPLSDSRSGKGRDGPSNVGRKKRPPASAFMNSLADFGEVKDDDLDIKELYKNAVSTVVVISSPEREVRKQMDSGVQEPPEPQAMAVQEFTTESEDDDDESETEIDLRGSYDDIKSADFSKSSAVSTGSANVSKASEVSMDLFAVFKESEPSELEKKLNNLQKKASHSEPYLASSASESARLRRQTDAPSAGRKAPPRRGVRKTKSVDLDLFASSIAAASPRGNLRSKSADLTSMAQSARSMPTSGNLKPSRSGGSLVSLASSTLTDDLDALFKQAAQVDSASSARMNSASNLNQDSLMALTHHMPNRSGEAALTTIITDTEETYGIEIPPNLVEALRKAVIGPFPDVPLLTIVKALHDDVVIEEAKRYYGQPIPNDLIAAVRLVSLPPGVSIEKLVPPEDGVSSFGQSRKNGDDASQDVEENTKPKSANFTPPEPMGEFTPLALPSPEFNRTLVPPPPPKVDDDEEITLDMLKDERSNSDMLWSRHTSMPPMACSGSKASRMEEVSLLSENSWGKLSLSGSPTIKVRKHKEKLVKPKRTQRASADQFVNSLADFGAPTDDIHDLFKHAVDSLDSYSPADAERDQLEDQEHKQLSRKKAMVSTLEAVMETSEGSFGSVGSVDSVDAGAMNAVMETSGGSFGSVGSVDSVDAGAINTVPRPQILESCIEVSPQEFELDMLLDAVEEGIGRAIPCEVDMALRKSSRSMDESLDFVAAVNTQLDTAVFGTHLPLEILEILYGEAAIFLGQKISPTLLAALRRASDSLYKTPGVRNRLGRKAPDEHDGAKQKRRRRQRREHKRSTKSQQKHTYQKNATTFVSYDEEAHMTSEEAPLNDSESWGVATTGVQSRVAPLQNKSNHSIDTFFNDSFHGSSDDLGEMYRAANAESQQENKLSHSINSFFLEVHNEPPTNEEAIEVRNNLGNCLDSHLGVAHFRKTDDLGEMFKAAYNELPSLQPSPPQSEKSPPPVPSFKVRVPFPSDAKSKVPDPSLKQQLSPPTPSFLSPIRNMTPPKVVGTTPNREELMSRTESGRFMFPEDLMSRTDSGRYMLELSPVTAASMEIDGGSFRELDKAVVMEASKVRLSALNSLTPDLDVDIEGSQNEGTGPTPDMPSFELHSLELPSLEAIPYEYDQSYDELGASTGDLSDFSPNASAELNDASTELNAIILETQAQFGMELPSELMEALKRTSINSLATDGDSLSLVMSEVSSLMMQSRKLDENAEASESNGLIMALRDKLSDTGDRASCSLALLDLEEDLVTLVHQAKQDYGEDVPPRTVFALRKAAFEILSTQEGSSRSCFQGEQFIHTLRRAGEIQGQPIDPVLLSALQRASECTTSRIHNNELRIETEAPSQQVDQDGSGFFSAVSESEYSRALDGIGSDLADKIIHEVAIVHGEVPEELIENLYGGDGDCPTDESLSLGLALVSDDSAGQNNGTDPLEYSSSTIGTSITINSNYFHKEQNPEAVPPAMNTDAMKQVEFNYLVDEVAKEYGKQLPPEFVHALRASSVGSDLTFESNSNAIISQTEKIYGWSFTEDIIDALQRASANASKSLPGSRQSSMSSATSLDNSLSSQSDWTVNDGVELTGLLVDQEGTSQLQPSSVAQHSAPTVAAIKNLGPSLLLGVRKIYPKKVPLELTYVLTRSTALPNAMNTDQELDIILVECEEMTGKRLPADLVVALREASVAIRTLNNSTRSRRSRLARQASGSCRSTSRSSGMPSIQESSNDDFEEPLCHEDDDTGQSTFTSTDSSFGMNSMLSELAEHTPKATKDQQDSLGKEPAENNSRKQLSVSVPPAPGIKIDRCNEDLEPIRPPASPLERTPSDKSERSEDVSITMDEAQSQKSKSQDLTVSSPRAGGNNSAGSKYSLINPGESPAFNSSTNTAVMSNTTEEKNSRTTEKKKKAWAPMLAQIAHFEFDGLQASPEPRSRSLMGRGSGHSGVSGGSDGSADRKKEAARRSSSKSAEITSGGYGGNRSFSNHESRILPIPVMEKKLGTKTTAPPASIESDDLNDIFKEAARQFSS